MTRGAILPAEPSSEQLLAAGYSAMYRVLRHVNKKVQENPKRYLRRLFDEELGKHLLKIDSIADEMASDFLAERFGKNIAIRGEESSLLELGDDDGLAVLLDMVDGTDLLQRGMGNWCAALVFFSPKKGKILCSLVGTPNYEFYYATASDPRAFVRTVSEGRDKVVNRQVSVDKGAAAKRVRLRNAGIAFYGQKAGSLLGLYRQRRFMAELEKIEGLAKKYKGTPAVPLFRIYNLAGNPMMMSLIEGKIDAIVECRGQLCHDVVPGFAIAINAGAYLFDIDSKKLLTLDTIGQALRTPKKTFRYVMASNRVLGRSLVNLFD